MRAAWEIDGRHLTLRYALHPEDPVEGPRWCSPGEPDWSGGSERLLVTQVSVVLPREVATPHGDLLALAAYSVVAPWTARRLELDRPVSARAAEGFATAVGVEVTPVDPDLAPRESPRRALLAYSSGIDSVAAAELLADDVVLVHSERRKHPWVPRVDDIYQTAAILPLVAEAGRRGWRTEVVATDVDYVCDLRPHQPTSFADGIGAILLADELGGGGVAWGNVLEAIYLGRGHGWTGGMREPTLPALFAAVGLDYLQPTGAITETGTTRLALGSSLADLARSCAVGEGGTPCHWCMKCVRKALVTAAVTGDPLDPRVVRNITPDHPVMTRVFDKDVFHYGNTVWHALARVDVTGTPLQAVKERIAPTREETRWNERWFAQGLDDLVTERWRGAVEARLRRSSIDRMDARDEAILRSWPERVAAV